MGERIEHGGRGKVIELEENIYTEESAGQELLREMACDHSQDCNCSQPIDVSTVGKFVSQRL